MSALTKVFVLLLVILSIVQTAGVVVFVNREQNFAVALKNQKDAFAAAKASESSIQGSLDTKTQQYIALQSELQNARNLYSQQIEQLRGAVADKEATVAQLTGQVNLATSAQKGATDALAVAQKSIDAQNTQIAELRATDLKLQKDASESSIALAEMTNKFDTVNRSWRDELEKSAQQQGTIKTQSSMLHRNGIDENTDRVVNQQSLVKVEGVIRNRNNINDVQMATISIGSADQVSKGMRLAIIDPQSNDPFLGYIDIERVEPNQAVGRLSGPHVDRVRPGTEVRSQL